MAHADLPSINIGDPLYARTASAIRQMIADGGLPAGHKIDSESILADKLGVSRVTLRRAVELLVDDHLLVRRQGVGTFVASARLTYPMLGLHSTREDLRAHGVDTEAQIVHSIFRKPSVDERFRLSLSPGERVYRFTRRDLVNNKPISIAQCVLPNRVARKIDINLLNRFSTYELIERELGMRLTRAHQLMRADSAPLYVAQLLDVTVDSPIFVLDRITYDEFDAPVEWGVVSYPHDRVEYSVELSRQSSGSHETATHVAMRYSAASE